MSPVRSTIQLLNSTPADRMENVFSLYTSFINPRMNVKCSYVVHEMSFDPITRGGCEFGVVLAVEPPGLAKKKNWTRKSEHADELSFFLISPLKRFQVLSNRNKEKCEQKWQNVARGGFYGWQQNIVMEKREKKRRQNPLIQRMIVVDVKYGIGKSLYSYRRFRRLPLTVPPH